LKLWDGRFQKNTDKQVEKFTGSLDFDKRLYEEDIEGSLAHAKMLGAVGLLSGAEVKAITTGLKTIKAELESGSFNFLASDEDIHMAIERRLTELVGEAGAKLHTGRSRNDQVVLDLRLYLKKQLKAVIKRLNEIRQTLVKLAEAHQFTVMPGYTHLQRAQPVFLAHHFLAYFFMLQRDLKRLEACYEETDVLPLGAAALAGSAFPLDRKLVAKELGFSKISANSLDTVSDRDFVVSFLAAASLLMVHLSRLAEEIVLWSTAEFNFIELDDAYATGSSIMPQKKNPDVAELIRGKTGRVFGHLLAVLTMLKGLPLAYNRDLQEDKEAVFDTVDTLLVLLPTLNGLLNTLKFNKEKLAAAASDFTLATDYADYLVTKGVPFRVAHHTVGKLVNYCLTEKKSLKDLSLKELQRFSDKFADDALALADPVKSASARNTPGGTGTESIKAQLQMAKEILNKI